jgi:hypothetical protein
MCPIHTQVCWSLTTHGASGQADTPNPPRLRSTVLVNPRGVDVVEPMRVYRVSTRPDGLADSTFLGWAKIPDPRRGEEGAFVGADHVTGALVRISEARVISEGGLRTMIEFELKRSDDRLVIHPGPHDEVVSRQGVRPIRSVPGREVSFDIRALYDSALVNPVSGYRDESFAIGRPRTALMTMRSTYPGGESVNLVVHLVPGERPAPLQPIQIVRRDTTIFVIPARMHVPPPPVVSRRPIGVVASVVTGYGPRYLHTHVPAHSVGSFTSRGRADLYYVEGYLRLEHPSHRWTAQVSGLSSLAESEFSSTSHHQVALQGDLRFEYGIDWYTAVEITGRLSDKPHQEFSWASADYAGTMMIGRGWRSTDRRGLENRRLEVVAGLRMGENRVIEVYRAGQRARGLGGEIALRGRIADIHVLGAEIHLTGTAISYAIAGRGARDSGFSERGVRLSGDVRIGQELGGMFVFTGARSMLRRERALYPRGDEFLMNDALIAPALGVEMRL